MWLPQSLPWLVLLVPALVQAAEEAKPKPKPILPCTITSSQTNSFYDLNGLAVPPLDGRDKKHKDDRQESWHARGYDSGSNYTLNFCAPVVESLKDVQGVDEKLWRNVSAYYTQAGKTYSLGHSNTELIFRGRKLVLNYTDGSPCGPSVSRRELIDDDDDDKDDEDDDKPKKNPSNEPSKEPEKEPSREPSKGVDSGMRKSAVISFLCEREAYDSSKPRVSLSFVSTDPYQCTYLFEARSSLACGGISKSEQTVGPGSVFGIIMGIALAVYFIGGVVYQRNVMHQRGWRQLPNYSMWAGMGSFIKDMVIILFSTCSRCIPWRRGYNQLPAQSSGGRARGLSSDDENRLIDNLDEEWDD